MPITAAQRRFFRDGLRNARAAVLADAEAYPLPLTALERLGRFLEPSAHSLGKCSEALAQLADESDFSERLPQRCPHFHRRFRPLLETVRDARNGAMHVGAKARHLTMHAVEVCTILEDALQQGLDKVSDFMVRDVVAAEMWQPVSLIRQRMLEHAFTFIPVAPPEATEQWIFISDHQLAHYLGSRARRLERLATPVGTALVEGLEATPANFIEASAPLDFARDTLGDQPLLVRCESRVVGIVTAFDLL